MPVQTTKKKQAIQHVFVPGLFDPLESWHRDYDFTPSSPRLVKKMAGMTRRKESATTWLSSIYELLDQNADKPANSHAQCCYTFDFGQPAPASVMCAEPIELEAGMSDIVVGQSVINDLTSEDNSQLADLLNQHFSQDGWEFLVSANNQWFLTLPESDKPGYTKSVFDALGNSLRHLVDETVDVQWSRQLNELQMLLHGSSVNISRENLRKRSVSSFWFWDLDLNTDSAKYLGGSPQFFEVRFIAGGGYEGKVIASHYGLEWIEFDVNHHSAESGIYIYNDLQYGDARGSLEMWQDKLTELESFLVAMLENDAIHTIIHGSNGYFWSEKNNYLGQLLAWRKKSLLDFL